MKLPRALLIAVFCTSLFTESAGAADADINQRLDRIERLLQSQGLLDMLQQIEALQRELSSLHGEIEFQNHTLEQLKKRQRDLYTDIDQRLQRLERAGDSNSSVASDITFIDTADDTDPPLQTIESIAGEIAPTSAAQQAEDTLLVEVIENNNVTPSTVEPQAQTAMPQQTLPGQENIEQDLDAIAAAPQMQLDPVQVRAQYQQAFKLLKQSQYEQAIKAFREFLLINPQSEYSDNAQYWLGEAYYVTRQFEAALVEYNKLLVQYPESKKLTHSLLKIGFCYYELGDMQEARSRLQELVQQHPGTTAARLADERLKKIALAAQQGEAAAN